VSTEYVRMSSIKASNCVNASEPAPLGAPRGKSGCCHSNVRCRKHEFLRCFWNEHFSLRLFCIFLWDIIDMSPLRRFMVKDISLCILLILLVRDILER